jgi:DNA primase
MLSKLLQNKTIVFLLKGYTDVIQFHQSGIENV